MNNTITKLLLMAGLAAASAQASAFQCYFEENEWGIWVPTEECRLDMFEVDADLLSMISDRYRLKMPNLIPRKLKANDAGGQLEIIARTKNIGTNVTWGEYRVTVDLQLRDANGSLLGSHHFSEVEQSRPAAGVGADLTMGWISRPAGPTRLDAVIRVDTVNMASGGEIVESNEADNSASFSCQIPSEDFQDWIPDPALRPCF